MLFFFACILEFVESEANVTLNHVKFALFYTEIPHFLTRFVVFTCELKFQRGNKTTVTWTGLSVHMWDSHFLIWIPHVHMQLAFIRMYVRIWWKQNVAHEIMWNVLIYRYISTWFSHVDQNFISNFITDDRLCSHVKVAVPIVVVVVLANFLSVLQIL